MFRLCNGFAIIMATFIALPAAVAAPVNATVTLTGDVTTPVKNFSFDCEGVAKGDDTGAVTVKLADMTTGMPGRAAHMRAVLKVATYPEAKLMLKTHDAKSFTGDLTLRGVTKPVSGTVDGKTASFDVKASDYGITQEELKDVGMQVKDVFHVKVEAK